MKAALRSALSDHAQAGTLAFVDGAEFSVPSTRIAVDLLKTWGQPTPTVVVVGEDEEALAKSFRNLDRVLVTVPSELEVAHVVWARSLLVSQAALDAVQGRAS
jgi:large subunit ribosomal protein L4